MIVLAIRTVGMSLLVLAGGGVGFSLYWQKREIWCRASCFVHLLEYLLLGIQYQAMPCEELLQQAALQTEFVSLDLGNCRTFDQISIPAGLPEATREELTRGLTRLSEVPHEVACRTLEQLLALCRSCEQSTQEAAFRARALYPKLGFCIGLLAAILFV